MASATSTEFRRGVVGPCILALLAQGPRYGLQLVRELDEIGGLLTSQGTVYPLLGRLQDSGLVTSDWRVTEGERPRRYYAITEAGRAELADFRVDWAAFAGAVDHVLRAAEGAPAPTESETP
jgi:PadR family transcriptional regulator, regulatory protein PadR